VVDGIRARPLSRQPSTTPRLLTFGVVWSVLGQRQNDISVFVPEIELPGWILYILGRQHSSTGVDEQRTISAAVQHSIMASDVGVDRI
jgi:hypothetical protein